MNILYYLSSNKRQQQQQSQLLVKGFFFYTDQQLIGSNGLVHVLFPIYTRHSRIAGAILYSVGSSPTNVHSLIDWLTAYMLRSLTFFLYILLLLYIEGLFLLFLCVSPVNSVRTRTSFQLPIIKGNRPKSSSYQSSALFFFLLLSSIWRISQVECVAAGHLAEFTGILFFILLLLLCVSRWNYSKLDAWIARDGQVGRLRECWQLTFVFFLCVWKRIGILYPPPSCSSSYTKFPSYILEKSSSGPFRRRCSENLFLQYYFRFSIHNTHICCVLCLFGLQLIIQPGDPSSVRLINQSTIQSTPDATTTTKEKMRYPFLSMFLCCCWCN